MICGWAGSLLCGDGISIVAGTGSICYGERGGAVARSGGWGELFSDEGSAYWIACRGLNLFSRMSDGRAARGPLYEIVRRYAGIAEDLDLCAHVFAPGGRPGADRAVMPMDDAGRASGRRAALAIVRQAAAELALMVDATRRNSLGFTAAEPVTGLLLGRRLRECRRDAIGAFRSVAAGASAPATARQTRIAARDRRSAVCREAPWPALVGCGDRASARAERGTAARPRVMKAAAICWLMACGCSALAAARGPQAPPHHHHRHRATTAATATATAPLAAGSFTMVISHRWTRSMSMCTSIQPIRR